MVFTTSALNFLNHVYSIDTTRCMFISPKFAFSLSLATFIASRFFNVISEFDFI